MAFTSFVISTTPPLHPQIREGQNRKNKQNIRTLLERKKKKNEKKITRRFRLSDQEHTESERNTKILHSETKKEREREREREIEIEMKDERERQREREREREIFLRKIVNSNYNFLGISRSVLFLHAVRFRATKEFFSDLSFQLQNCLGKISLLFNSQFAFSVFEQSKP